MFFLRKNNCKKHIRMVKRYEYNMGGGSNKKKKYNKKIGGGQDEILGMKKKYRGGYDFLLKKKF